MSQNQFKIEWIHDPNTWLALQAEWKQVYERDGREHPFLNWVWCWHWWQLYSKSDWTLNIGVVFKDQRAVGILPWYSYIQRSMGMTFKVVSCIGTGEVSPPWMDAIGSREDWASVPSRTITDAISKQEWSILDQSPILPGSNFANFIAPLFESTRTEVVNSEVSPIIPLGGNFEDWLATLGGSTRKDLRRKRTAILQDTNLRIVRHSTLKDVTAALPKIVELNRSRLSYLKKHGAFHLPTFSDFHQRLAPIMATQNSCEIYELRQGNQVLASQLYYGKGETRYSYLSGMDPAAVALGPGGILDVEIFAVLMNDSTIRSIDLGIGDQEYKIRYGAIRRIAFRHTIFRTNFMRQLSSMRRSIRRQINIPLPLSKGAQV